MMDYEQLNVEGWLEDAPFFPNEPNDYSLNFDLQKANKETAQVTEFNDLPWYDENVNLSLLEDVLQLRDASTIQLSDTDIKELLSLISNSDSSYLPSDNLSLTDDSNIIDFNLNEYSSEDPFANPSDFLFSPTYETSEASSPAEYPFSPDIDAASTDYISPSSVESSDAALCSVLSLAPENATSLSSKADNFNTSLCSGSEEETSVAGDAIQSCQESMPAVFVTVCDTNVDDPAVDLSFEEVSTSVRKRKFVNNGQGIPKVRVSLKNTFHPYSKGSSKRRGDKSERKKVQNKEAAARYRIKKRIEEQELSGEVAALEAEQKKLQTQHDDLATEIKYLKKLMREMLEKKGII